MYRVRSTITALLAAVMVITAFGRPFVMASEADESYLEDLQNQDQEKAEEEYAANQELYATRQKVEEMQATIQDLDERITTVEATIRDLDGKIADNMALLETTMTDLEKSKETQAIWYQRLKLRLKAVYESGEVNYLEVLLQAGSMSELFSKAEYSRVLAQYDQDILTSLNDAREDVQKKQARVEEEEKSLEENRAEQESQKTELQSIKKEKDAELEKLSEDQGALEMYVAGIQADREYLAQEMAVTAARIEEARRKAEEEAARRKAEEEERQREADEAARRKAEEEERRRREEEERRRREEPEEDPEEEDPYDEPEDEPEDEPTYDDPEPSYTGMIWPLPGYSHLSTYFGVGGHRGIDIPAPSGTPILASAGGTVITAQWNNSYGNYVAISHGNGMVTVYAHASALCVSVGDTVSAGTTVALVGTTGYSTGNHLHFEVQINGSLYNPLDYVSP